MGRSTSKHHLDLKLNQSVQIVLEVLPSNQEATMHFVMALQQLATPYLLQMRYLAMHQLLALLATCP
ncbi:MAG: hypothetical protein EBT95_11195 [Verrucomicrobia bacterium]|nr:hypothetical protein [Verrucomicrobiota bacterium]